MKRVSGWDDTSRLGLVGGYDAHAHGHGHGHGQMEECKQQHLTTEGTARGMGAFQSPRTAGTTGGIPTGPTPQARPEFR